MLVLLSWCPWPCVCETQTQVLTSVRVLLQELWGTGNQTPLCRQSSPSPPGRGVGGFCCAGTEQSHLPEAGFSSGAPPALPGTSDSRGWRLQSHRLLPSPVTPSAQPCCSSGAARDTERWRPPRACPAWVGAGVVLQLLECRTKPSAPSLVVLGH